MILSRPPRSTAAPRVLAGLLAAVLIMITAMITGPARPAAADDGSAYPNTYRNAVSDAFSDTFADPSVILAKDGWWYAFATADPLYAGEPSGGMHIARTKDWSHWEYRGTVFNDSNRPSYATANAGLWAPDIRYIDGRYVLYYTVTDTTLNAGEDPAIGVATADRPDGPWTPTDAPIIAPRLRPGTTSYLGTIDPAGFTDVDGRNYLYFGGYNGGFWASEVSADGLTALTDPADYTEVAIDNRYEGGYVVRHDGWYYFMASTANCCAGPTTGYSVYTGRSRSPLGPFVDADGRSLLDPYVGGTNLIIQNGNRWIGVGHHAIATDAEGRDFIVYHGIDRTNPWLNQPFGINRRPMLIDRIDWIDGWPRARAGAGPSDTAQPAPVHGSGLGISSDDPAAGGVKGLTSGPQDAQSGATARLNGSASTRRAADPGSLRLGLDLRLGSIGSARPFTVRAGDSGTGVTMTVDPSTARLSLRTVASGTVRTATDQLPADLLGAAGWQHLTVQVDGHGAFAWISQSDLSDPAAEVRLERTDLSLPAAPVGLSGAAVVDNLTVRPVAVQADRMVATPEAGDLLVSDDFDDPALPGWTWLRRDDNAVVADGALTWPLQNGDLVGSGTPGVLLHDPVPNPNSDWMVETKLTLDLGTDEVRNYQQAGLVVYRNDDDFARLDKVAIWNTRQVEFGRELVATSDGRTSWGGSIQATPGRQDTWLRLAHHTNAAGEHLFRAAVSTDGEHWTWGAVWTFAAGAVPRIGLVAQGGASPATDAIFDYVRFYAVK